MSASGRTIDLDEFLDGMPFGEFHWRAIVLGVAIMLVDGYEVGVLGLVLPKLAQDFGTTATALTWVLSAQQVGMVLGACLVAPLADRIGRRPLVLFGLFAVGLCSLVTLVADGLAALAACRLITGIFASTLIANLVSWIAEIAPARSRTLMVTGVLTGSTAGAILGSLVQAFVLDRFGWQGAFWIGSIMPLALVPIGWSAFAESPRFLAARRPDDPRLVDFLRAQGIANGSVIISAPTCESQASAGSPIDLFRDGRGRATLLLWCAFFLDFLFISAWFWKTTIFYDLGLTWPQIALATSIEVVAGAVGMLTIGAVVSRFPLRTVVPVYFLFAALCMVLLGAAAPASAMFGVLALMAAFQNAAHAGLALIASDLYPSRCRATGVGWAYGAGRAASILGPPFGAIPMAQGFSPLPLFAFLALPLVCACLTVVCLIREKRDVPDSVRDLETSR